MDHQGPSRGDNKGVLVRSQTHAPVERASGSRADPGGSLARRSGRRPARHAAAAQAATPATVAAANAAPPCPAPPPPLPAATASTTPHRVTRDTGGLRAGGLHACLRAQRDAHSKPQACIRVGTAMQWIDTLVEL
eukprot:7382246-Prymnesium_polylepis.1